MDSELKREIQIRLTAGERKPPVGRRIRMRPPDAQWRQYVRLMRQEAGWLAGQFDRLIEALPEITEEAGFLNQWDDTIEREADSLESAIQERESYWRELAAGIGTAILLHNKREHERAVRNWFGVRATWRIDPQVESDALRSFARENARLIKGATQTTVVEVSSLVRRNVRQGKRPQEMREMIQQRLGVAESRARLIARDQSNKLFGQASRIRQESVGVESYVWQTSEDERVREEHEDRNGETFDWSDPPSDGHPGEPVQCRCTAEPDLSGLLND